MKKRLTTSIYTFETIIEQNGMYVDKTRDIYQLVREMEGQFFLSRPRRFGKSMTLSTLKAIFEGKKELFKGLYIYEQDYDWQKHPIIHLSLNSMSSENISDFSKRLCIALDRIADENEIKLLDGSETIKFEDLIYKLHKKYCKVVVLIDEYDKPILDNILKKTEVSAVRDLLKRFYGIIKACESMIRFTFITGVGKFSKVSIFSDLNNLTDITMHPDFATLCGFTQEECEHYFAEYIEENALQLKMSKEAYLQKLKDTYNGIRFTKKDLQVYNPVSFTRAMSDCDFNNYWFETGTPTFLLKMLKEQNYNMIELEAMKLKPSTFTCYEVERIQPEALLYQTGYLTIKNYDPQTDVYTLSYPNREVRESFVEKLVDYFTPVNFARVPSLLDTFIEGINCNNFEDVLLVLNAFYAKIDNSIKIKHEKYYQTVFYIFFTLLGYRLKVEVNTNRGRMDAVLFTDNHIYIFEFKLDKPAATAIEQIKQRGYSQRFADDKRKIIMIGVAFTSETGEIKEHLIEEF